jgi:hypothetical protein
MLAPAALYTRFILLPACVCAAHSCRTHLYASTAEGEDAVRGKLRAVNEELVERFRALEEEFR